MVPEGWMLCRLDDIADYRRGSFPQPYGLDKWFDENGHPFVQVYDVDKNLKLKPFTKTKISDLAAEQSVFAPEGTILVTLQGSIGRVAITQYPAYVDRTLLVIRGLKLSGDDLYLATSLQELFAKEKERAPGGTIKTITKAVLSNFKIFWPPAPEQKKIAQILSTWDLSITATERLLENSQQRKKGLMQQLLTGKKRLPGFEGEWRQEELSKLVTISKGEQLNRSTLSEAGLYPVINGGITPSGYTDKTNCHGNTVTISEGGNSCGFVAFQQAPFWCGGHCYALKSPQVPVMFLYQLLKLYEVKIMRMRVGSGLPNIQKKDLSGLKLALPTCTDEQEAIGQTLGLADKECQLLVDRLNSLKQEKKALMQQLLTGKRRVQVDTEAA